MENQEKVAELPISKQINLKNKIEQLENELQELKKLLIKETTEKSIDGNDLHKIQNLHSSKQVQNMLTEHSGKRCTVQKSLKLNNLKKKQQRKKKKCIIASKSQETVINGTITKDEHSGEDCTKGKPVKKKDLKRKLRRKRFKAMIKKLNQSIKIHEHNNSEINIQSSSELKKMKKKLKKKKKKLKALANNLNDSLKCNEEEKLLYGIILYAAEKENNEITHEEWIACCSILQTCISAPIINSIEHAIKFLMNRIQKACVDDSNDKECMLTNAVLILAAYQKWKWTKNELICKYLFPAIKRYSSKEKCEKMLSLFCNLYAEVCRHCPPNSKPEKILMDLFEKDITNAEDAFIKEVAALSLIKLLLTRNPLLPEELKKWLQTNANNPKVASLAIFFHRRCVANSDPIHLEKEI